MPLHEHIHIQNAVMKQKALFNESLHKWYNLEKRDLPWRTKPSAYKTLVSELMLQQTQVKTALPYFNKWLIKYPNIQSLAKASEKSVLKSWEGLGYYSRAKNLHKTAQALCLLKKLPTKHEEWKTLPGIGPYTAAAISSIAFNEPNAVVDGNVVRILSRINGIKELFTSTAKAIQKIQPLADELVQVKNPGDHNQAMMELGATICKKGSPSCDICPVSKYCYSFKHGCASEIPLFESKKIEKITIDRAWMFFEEKLLLYKNPKSSKRLANIWEMPSLDLIKPIKSKKLIFSKKRSISNQSITEKIYSLSISSNKAIKTPPNCYWVKITNLKTTPLSGPHAKWINEILINP